MRQLAFCVLLGLCACSRPSTEAQNDTTALPSAGPAPATPLTVAPESSSPQAPPSVLTPEDAEEDAAHRITEQNLESELDRLEREIQAE
ncbi:MAG: hypothetical protein EOO73_09495 [Myxococcales bacterium]|nr:MAG: hypothetical protein EOO73_09495 [Myxococcales bacterium]